MVVSSVEILPEGRGAHCPLPPAVTEQAHLLPEALAEDALPLPAAMSVPGVNRRGDSRYFGSFPVDLGMSSTILSRPRSHLSFTIPQAIRKVLAPTLWRLEVPSLEGTDPWAARGKGPCAPQNGCWAGVCVSAPRLWPRLPAGAYLLASFKITLQRGGKGSHWRAEQEKEE